MWEAIGVLVAGVGVVVSLYAARGGGLDGRLLQKAKADLELSAALPDGPLRDQLLKHAQQYIAKAMALRSTQEIRSLTLVASVVFYALAAYAGGSLALDRPVGDGRADTWSFFAVGLALGALMTAQYVKLRIDGIGFRWIRDDPEVPGTTKS